MSSGLPGISNGFGRKDYTPTTKNEDGAQASDYQETTITDKVEAVAEILKNNNALDATEENEEVGAQASEFQGTSNKTKNSGMPNEVEQEEQEFKEEEAKDFIFKYKQYEGKSSLKKGSSIKKDGSVVKFNDQLGYREPIRCKETAVNPSQEHILASQEQEFLLQHPNVQKMIDGMKQESPLPLLQIYSGIGDTLDAKEVTYVARIASISPYRQTFTDILAFLSHFNNPELHSVYMRYFVQNKVKEAIEEGSSWDFATILKHMENACSDLEDRYSLDSEDIKSIHDYVEKNQMIEEMVKRLDKSLSEWGKRKKIQQLNVEHLPLTNHPNLQTMIGAIDLSRENLHPIYLLNAYLDSFRNEHPGLDAIEMRDLIQIIREHYGNEPIFFFLKQLNNPQFHSIYVSSLIQDEIGTVRKAGKPLNAEEVLKQCRHMKERHSLVQEDIDNVIQFARLNMMREAEVEKLYQQLVDWANVENHPCVQKMLEAMKKDTEKSQKLLDIYREIFQEEKPFHRKEVKHIAIAALPERSLFDDIIFFVKEILGDNAGMRSVMNTLMILYRINTCPNKDSPIKTLFSTNVNNREDFESIIDYAQAKGLTQLVGELKTLWSQKYLYEPKYT